MRITRDALLKIAKDTAEKKFAPDKNVTAVSCWVRCFLMTRIIAGTTDVDLLVIYNANARSQEIVKLSNDFHIDIRYESASLYAQPRETARRPLARARHVEQPSCIKRDVFLNTPSRFCGPV